MASLELSLAATILPSVEDENVEALTNPACRVCALSLPDALGENMTSYLIFTSALRVWLAIAILLAIIAVGDLVFSPEHSFTAFAKRLLLSALWPLALFTAAGRKTLLRGFRPTQGV
jgi:hypothetical protein